MGLLQRHFPTKCRRVLFPQHIFSWMQVGDPGSCLGLDWKKNILLWARQCAQSRYNLIRTRLLLEASQVEKLRPERLGDLPKLTQSVCSRGEWELNPSLYFAEAFKYPPLPQHSPGLESIQGSCRSWLGGRAAVKTMPIGVGVFRTKRWNSVGVGWSCAATSASAKLKGARCDGTLVWALHSWT